MPAPFRGVFTIPATPFDEHWQLDEAGLRRVVDFCIECGAHGLVYPVNASQFSILSDEERLRGSRIVVEQCAGRIPVMVGTQGLCTEHAVMFSREAQAMGADAVIAMTPYVAKIADAESIVAYFQGISDAVNIPICVQNHAVGTEMSAALLARLVREVEHVEYIKEEVMPTTHRITEVTARAARETALSGPKLKGVFGGAGGRYLLTEYPRGVAGQMPGCHVTDVVVKLWNALERGERAEAKRIFGLMAPLFAIELLCRGAIYKEVLRRRGVIASARSRNAPPDAMDAADHEALDEILADLEPLMTWKGFGSPPPR